MGAIVKCLLKKLASLPFWLAWIIVTIVGLILAGALDAVWTFVDSLRGFPGIGDLWKAIFPPHPPWGLFKWVWGGVTDFGGWILYYFEC